MRRRISGKSAGLNTVVLGKMLIEVA